VTIAGQTLPFFYASSTQLNVQLPWNLPAGANSVTVSSGGLSATAAFNVVTAAPGIFTYGSNLAVAQNQDYTLNTASNPAEAGSYVTAYLTGIGPLDNPVGLAQADIQIPPGLAPGTYPIQIQMGSFLSNAPLITTN